MDTQIKRINRTLVWGWFLIVMILFVSYVGEVLRGNRTVPYLIVFMLITALPMIGVAIQYVKNKESENLRYYVVIGYFFMYVFVMLTGSTTLVFTYILPLMAFLVIYHDPQLVMGAGIIATVINLVSIFMRCYRGELEAFFTKDTEIQLALLFLCILAAYLATRIYDSIYQANEAYTKELADQREELYQQAEELEAMNGERNKYSDELLIKNAKMREMTMQTIMTIANTIDAKDEYTRGHSRRVADYAVAIAGELGLSEEQIEDIRFIGLLHDIGKIGVPDSVLNKPGKLSNEEYQLMKDHTTIGGEILKDITMIDNLDVGAKYHHERFDGKGYPEGLKGEEIPLIARIIGVADAYDAMTSNRIYRRHLEADRVLAELKKGNGTQFDPRACEAMIRLVEEGRLPQFNPDSDSTEMKQTTQILTRVIDKAEETAQEEIQIDELTGTLSRGQGVSVMQEQISRYGTGSLFIFDIDNFRRINETEGFMIGDKYLRILSDKIKRITEDEIVSRFGADEFVAYMPKVDTAEDAEDVARTFTEDIRQMIARDSSIAKLSVSIGITQIATEKDKVMVSYENASKALFVAKQYGGGNYFCHRLEKIDEDDVEVANSSDLEYLMSILKRDDMEMGALVRSVPEFAKSYDMVKDVIMQSSGRVHVVLFTLRDIGEVTVEAHELIMGYLERAIAGAIKNMGDAAKYTNMQYVVLLQNLDEMQTKQVINRILADFYRIYDKKDVEVHYDAADLS
ncbi:MAG: HD domain-containing protein [Lachnospiraceae bacterium]|nr:HD domain-containing protein [Lachnospiraceae bacterium]